MQLSQTNAYAVAAMIRIASLSPGQLASCHEICRGVEMPERYVLQLLRKLVNAGVIRSTRGRDGGFRLAKPAAKVSLLEIIEAIDGRLGFNSPVEIAGLSTAGKAVLARRRRHWPITWRCRSTRRCRVRWMR